MVVKAMPFKVCDTAQSNGSALHGWKCNSTWMICMYPCRRPEDRLL